MKIIYSSSQLSPDNNPRYINITLDQFLLKLELLETNLPGILYEDILSENNSSSIEPLIKDSIIINLEELFIPNNCFSTMLTKNNLHPTFIEIFNVTEIENTRDAYSLISFFKRADYSTSINLFFGETIDDWVLTSSLACQCKDIEINITNLSPSQIVVDYFPAYKDKIAIRNIRREILSSLDPNDTLSYLEAQVDILTKILLELVKSNTDIMEKIPELNLFKDVFEETNIFNVKSIQDGIQEMINGKSKVRKYQKRYFEQKNMIREV